MNLKSLITIFILLTHLVIHKLKDMDEIEWSDGEETVEWMDAKGFKLPFGRYKERPLLDMIKTKQRRSYLRYLLEWTELKPYTRARIQCAVDYFDELKTRHDQCHSE